MTADKPTPKPALIPKLRFPEFRNEPEWKPAQLSSVAHFVNDRVSVSAIAKDEYVSTENILPNFAGIAPPSSFPASGSVTRFCINDVLIANIRPYLKKVWKATRSGGASNDVLVVRKKSDTSADYLAALLQSDAFIDYVMVGAKGVKMPRGDISLIRQYPVSIPKPAEQKKIADCLGSLDDLIVAEGRKLETLKMHKKGLLQQLFPRPGETTPRLRFPEFRDSGEWEEKRLSNLIKLISGVHLAPDMYSTTGEAPYFTGPSDFTDVIQCVTKWADESPNTAKRNDTLITVKGSGVGEIWYLTLPSVAIGRQLMAVRTEIGDKRFIYHFLSTKGTQFKTLASGNLIPGLSRGDILDMGAYFPSQKEQKKIAGCLGSLDDLIAAEGRKLETLKVHKKGLLQQLFPAMTGPSI